jgi:hypothetical protein
MPGHLEVGEVPYVFVPVVENPVRVKKNTARILSILVALIPLQIRSPNLGILFVNLYSFAAVSVTGRLPVSLSRPRRGRPLLVHRVRILHACSCSSSAQRAYNASTIFCALANSASTFCSRR